MPAADWDVEQTEQVIEHDALEVALETGLSVAWGDVPTWGAAVGTVAAVIVALWQSHAAYRANGGMLTERRRSKLQSGTPATRKTIRS